MIRPALIALLALAAPAAATPPEPDGLTPGFWIFPSAPARDAAHLRELCAHGFTLVQTDGSWLSFHAPPGSGADRLIVDAEAVCSADGAGQVCGVHLYGPGDAMTAHHHATSFGRDKTGSLVARLTVDGTRQMTSFPQMCPPEAVRDLMVGWLAPRAGG